MPKSKKQSGAAHAKKAGLVLIALTVPPDVRDRVGVAAALTGDRSMAMFSRRVVEALSRKVLSDKRLQNSEKFSEFLETI